MQFSDVLASSIHDIKNSLGMVIHTIDALASDPATGLAGDPRAVALQLEAQRANNDLIQLLTLYKFENERITPNIEEHNLEDFLDDIAVSHRALAAARGIAVDYECDPDLNGYFDQDLIRGVVNSAIGNAERYTRDRILLGAEQRDGFTVIRVEDNGRGFPPAMLEEQENVESGLDFARGRTALGLYFSNQVVRVHRERGREGKMRLENGYTLEGGCFSLWLP